MDVYPRTDSTLGAGGWSQSAKLRGHAHELGDMRSPCSPPCPPPGTHPIWPHGGHQRVPRQVQATYAIASRGQAGAAVRGLTRTCAVVANCHHRATCGFAPACRAARPGLSPASGLIRTSAVVPIWHHRVTWGSTEPPTRHWPAPGLENKPDNNGSAKLAEPYDLGRRSGPLRPRPAPRDKPEKYGPANLAGPYDRRKCSDANHARISVPSGSSPPAPPGARPGPHGSACRSGSQSLFRRRSDDGAS